MGQWVTRRKRKMEGEKEGGSLVPKPRVGHLATCCHIPLLLPGFASSNHYSLMLLIPFIPPHTGTYLIWMCLCRGLSKITRETPLLHTNTRTHTHMH